MANLDNLKQSSLQNFLASLIGQSIDSVSNIVSSILNLEKTPDIKKLSPLSELDNYWNEGIKEIMHNYKELYDNNKIFDTNEEPYNSISTIGIKNTDAQYQQSLDKNFSNFVIPQKNYKNDYYSSVRGEDFFIKIANDKTNLQYTNNKKENNRLLMPKNSRRVEIEDLNKNFWVISQQLSIICNSLFNPKSYQNNIMNGIIKQILKIWDSILLLWIGVSKVFQNNTLIFFLPISFGSNSFDKRFDNIDYEKYDDSIVNKEIYNQCYSLCKKYQNSNLFIFPLLRGNNYYKNYFSKIKIPFYYKKEKGSNEMIKINQDDGKEIISIDIEETELFNQQKLSEQLYGFREKESTMEFYYPFNRNLSNIEKQKLIRDQANAGDNNNLEIGFYCAIRIIPKVELNMDLVQGLIIKKIDFDIIDLVEEILNQSLEEPEKVINEQIVFYNKKYSEKIGNIRLIEKSNNTYGHYMGEVLSCRKAVRIY